MVGSQDGRRVDRADGWMTAAFEHLAVRFGHTERRSPQRLTRRCAQRDDDIGFDEFEFAHQPSMARFHFGAVRRVVDATLPTRVPLEVLDRVGDVHIAARNAGLLEGIVEHSACRPDERRTFLVLLVAGLFTDQEEMSADRAIAEHGLGRSRVEITSGAFARFLRDDVQLSRH